MVAGVIETDAAGIVAAARVAVGACSAVPQRLPALEAALLGQPLAAAADIVAAGASRSPRAHRRHPRLGRLPRGRRRSTLVRDLLAELAGDPTAEGRLMQDTARDTRDGAHGVASR